MISAFGSTKMAGSWAGHPNLVAHCLLPRNGKLIATADMRHNIKIEPQKVDNDVPRTCGPSADSTPQTNAEAQARDGSAGRGRI
jgi:hypothetical protein